MHKISQCISPQMLLSGFLELCVYFLNIIQVTVNNGNELLQCAVSAPPLGGDH